MAYTATFDRTVPGLRFIDRSAEGFLDIVYEQGLTLQSQRPYDAGPYVITILKDGASFQTIERPNHYYESCWWVDLAPVTKIKRDPATLIAEGCVPPFGDTGIAVKFPTAGGVKFNGPMTLSSDTTGYEPQAGGRGDIGILTDNGAEFMCTNDPRNMLEDAKGVATQPIWDYDPFGRLLDLVVNPHITHYSTPAQGGAPNWLGPFPPKPSDIRPLPNPLPPENPSTPQTAHMAELCGLVAMAYGSPRYVRALQARVIRGFNEDTYWVNQYGGVTIFNREMRGVAHLARQLFYCYKATKFAEEAGNLPADCHGSAHWKTIIDNQVVQFKNFIEPSPFFKTFAVVGGSRNAWWQCDMLTTALGLYAQEWPGVWGPIYVKAFRNLAARVNADGLMQWRPAAPTWYWANLGPDDTTPFSGFPELWNKWSVGLANNDGVLTAAQVAALNADPYNGGTFVNPSEYESWVYAGLAFGVFLDRGKLKGALSAAYPNLEVAFAKYHAMMKKWVDTANGYLIPQCSIAVTPTTQPQEPPVSNPGTDPLAALKTATDAIAALTPRVQAAVDTLEAQIAALKAVPAGTGIDATALAAVVTKLEAARNGLAAAVEDAAS